VSTILTVIAPAAQAASASKTLVIASDLPLDSTDFASSDSINKAISLYLKEIDYKAGKFKVSLQIYDDSTTAVGGWDPTRCAANAIAHVAHSAEVAVMGTFNSGCSKLEVPILNQAPKGPLLIVSNANTNPGLTKSWGAGEPDLYYPTGLRNYARVCTTDDQQGAADAEFLKSKGVKSVYVLNDSRSYGIGVAEAFTSKAKALGIKVLSTGPDGQGWDPTQSDYTAIFQKILPLHPEAIFAGGAYSNNGAAIIKDKVAVLGDNLKVKFMAPDGFSGYPAFLAAPEAQGAYLSFAGLSDALLTKTQPHGVAAKFLTAYQSAYGVAPVGSYPIYGVSAIQVILAAIAKSDGTRKSITNAVFSGAGITIPLSTSVLDQTISINTLTGDTTAKNVTIEQVEHNEEVTLQGWAVK
jgi:branched-chain amino acid transport system substrate-binding protein